MRDWREIHTRRITHDTQLTKNTVCLIYALPCINDWIQLLNVSHRSHVSCNDADTMTIEFITKCNIFMNMPFTRMHSAFHIWHGGNLESNFLFFHLLMRRTIERERGRKSKRLCHWQIRGFLVLSFIWATICGFALFCRRFFSSLSLFFCGNRDSSSNDAETKLNTQLISRSEVYCIE